MELIPKEIVAKIPALFETQEQEQNDPTVFIKLFTPDSNWTWFIIELSMEEDICFGYVISPSGRELGYFSLTELSFDKESLGLTIERDLSFTPLLLSLIMNQL